MTSEEFDRQGAAARVAIKRHARLLAAEVSALRRARLLASYAAEMHACLLALWADHDAQMRGAAAPDYLKNWARARAVLEALARPIAKAEK